jgi:hypothetical protein
MTSPTANCVGYADSEGNQRRALPLRKRGTFSPFNTSDSALPPILPFCLCDWAIPGNHGQRRISAEPVAWKNIREIREIRGLSVIREIRGQRKGIREIREIRACT